MRSSRVARCLTIMTLVTIMVASMVIPAYAADFRFSYVSWEKSGTDFSVYTKASNKKSYNFQEATVKGTEVEYDQSTNGWGFRVAYKGDSSGNTVTLVDKDKGESYADVTKRTYWLNGNYTIHPEYRSGYGGKETYHFVAARLDDASATGKYTFRGYFNSDYT